MSDVISIKSNFYWWLSKSRPFFIGDEYKIELVAIDVKHGTAKINITNLKTNKIVEESISQIP